MAPRYGFIGLGTMGYGMGLNIRQRLPCEAEFYICEINQEQQSKFVIEASKFGKVQVSHTPKELASTSDIIFTSLPSAKIVQDVFINPATGLLAGSPQGSGKLFIELSTIQVSGSRTVLEAIQKSGAGDFIDAPVSGGIPAANAGTLTLLVGGSREVYDKALPAMLLIGKREKIFYCGEAGAGLVTKQINNYIGNVSYMALCEGMNTGLKFGLDPKILADAINASSGMCWNSIHMNPVKGVQAHSPAANDWRDGFKTELAADVTGMMVELMEEVHAKSVLGPVIQDVYKRALESPLTRGKECRSIYRLLVEDDGSALGVTKIE